MHLQTLSLTLAVSQVNDSDVLVKVLLQFLFVSASDPFFLRLLMNQEIFRCVLSESSCRTPFTLEN